MRQHQMPRKPGRLWPGLRARHGQVPRWRSLVAMGGLLLAGAGHAQEPAGPLARADASRGAPVQNMVSAVRAAIAAHPTVRTAVGQALEAGEGIAAARSGYYPKVNAGISSTGSSANVEGVGNRPVQQASLQVSQMLYDFGKVDSSVREAEASTAAARARVLVAVDDVARETAQAWVEMQRQRALGEIAQAQVERVQALAGLALERQVKGATSQSDVTQAQSRVEAARAQQLNAASQAERWRITLMHLTQGQVPGNVESGAAAAALDGACAARPEVLTEDPAAVRVARAERDVAQAAVRGADAQMLPTLSLDGTLKRGIDSASRRVDSQATGSSLMLNFTAPLYEGGRSEARKRAALHAVEAAESALGYAQLNARQRLEDARIQVAGHEQRQPVLARRASSTQTTRELYREQYLQLGTRSLLDLLNAEQEFHTARGEQVDGVHEAQRLAVECLYQSGRLRDAFDLAAPVAELAGAQP